MVLKNEIILVLSLITGSLLLIILAISSFLLIFSVYFSVFFLILALGLIIRYLSLSLLFPGSNKFLKRIFESAFAQDLSLEFIEKLIILKQFLKSFQMPPLHVDYKSFRQLYYLIKQNLAVFCQLTLSSKQEMFFSTLKDLKFALKSAKMIDKNRRKYNLWEILKKPSKVNKNLEMRAKGDLLKVFNLCEQAQVLLETDEEISVFRILWYDGVVLGDLDQKRADFMNRFSPEREFLDFGTVKIDSVLIKSCQASEVAVIYCSPNAGFYEYLYYQSDWLNFYIELNISVYFYNYRGYSLSTGSPSLRNLASDCSELVNYARHVKGFKKIILHGESLGGSVAISAASLSHIDLLIADRTFSSVTKVFSHYSGSSLLGGIFTYLGPGNTECVSQYLSVKCPKILTCDPQDKVIPVRSSLLSGISEQFQSKLSEKLLKDFKNAIQVLSDYKLKYSTRSESFECLFNVKPEHLQYNQLARDEEEYVINELFFKFLVTSALIDSAGLSLNELLDHGQSHSDLWLRNLEVWGSTPYIRLSLAGDPNYFSVLKLRNFLKKAKKLVSEFFTTNKSIQKIVFAIQTVNKVLAELLALLENRFQADKKKGNLLVLGCGHSGVFNEVEKLWLKKMVLENVDVKGSSCLV